MQRRILFTPILLLFFNFSIAQTFRSVQQKAPRVKSAYSEKWDHLKNELQKKGFASADFELFVRIFKNEKIVETWLRNKNEKEFRLFKTYDICYYSGELGPKRKQGDGQVPEGFYKIEAFNPYSNYHLSLRVSYPNASDKIIGKANLGGDIMIHGNCLSIGCVPITDTYIKELYILAVEAKNGGQESIPIHIFPNKLDTKGMALLNEKYGDGSVKIFWNNLKTGYDYFEKNKKLPKIEVDKSGKYIFL
ncbi:MAG: Pollen allergen Poa pIX/Phl pVI [Bacteroidetes bacterium]|jgi:murein L,D-transpeptidase YafK|nr:Pollen allergen Poa pIX/Phl pVI [Bacteroidota bacterium]